MKNHKVLCISTIITEFVIVLLTISAELSEEFKNTLKALSGHHWTSKGIIALILFFTLYFAFRKTKTNDKEIWKYTKAVFWFTIIFSLIIFLFFAYEFLV